MVEDSPEDAELLAEELRRSGYDLTYERVQTAAAMRAALDRQRWDIVLSDYSMPNFNGLAALTMVRENGGDLPFIMVSGKIGEDIAVSAMKAGAQDYFIKGNLTRLPPAVERELREAAGRRDRIRSEDQLRQSEERFRQLAENITEVFWMTTPDKSEMLYISPGYEKVWGRTCESLYERPTTWLDAIHPDDREWVVNAALSQQTSGAYDEQYRIIRPDGTTRWIRDRAFPIKDASGRIFRIGGVAEDITERKQAEDLIQHRAFHDPLTELPNRNRLCDRLLDSIRRDDGKGRPMALLLMDLDRFKEVNNTLGHDCGDRLLQEVGRRLKAALFEQDVVARLGGDEFAVWLPKIADSKHIEGVIQKILEALRSPFMLENIPIMVEASIGVALYPDHGNDAETLFRRADVAMYRAKGSGIGHAVYSRNQDQYNPVRLALMGELRHAIEHDELLLHYQPTIRLKDRMVAGVEALVRWKHPNRGMIPPDQFIGPAEQTGLIYPLTHWVLQTAMRQCGVWWRAGVQMPVSINLSARNLSDAKLPGQVADLLRATGVSPDWMTFEITESAIMADPAHALEILTTIHETGVRLSIDDFGTGYSSLSYLRKLPVDRLKVDKSFVIHMTENEGDAKIVRSTIDLAHNLDLEVVAEGVETQEVLDRLTEMGCDAAQGYYMSKPLPANELTHWLKHSPWGLNHPQAA
jgi:diguanylate cyclase (GGDEF)-like protein/PAS domain S-box-containing protein